MTVFEKCEDRGGEERKRGNRNEWNKRSKESLKEEKKSEGEEGKR